MSTRIREFRKLRGMTLNYLAQKVGTTAQTIQRLETDNMTVSLDWLQRIADVFGLPAAALLVTDTTSSVPVLGDLNGQGEVLAPEASAPAKTLSLVVASPRPIAVRVAEAMGPFEPETVLIANKLDFDREMLLESCNCLVGLNSGRVVLRRVTCNSEGVALDAINVGGSSGDVSTDIDWVAPLIMSVRYF